MKLNLKQTVLIGFAFMSILCFWQFYDQVIPYLLEYKFNLTPLKANAIMAIDNVLAIFMLPLFGAISDRTKTRLGKRTPYILFGTIAAVILLNVLSYFVTTVYFPGFFICLVLLLIVMAIYRSPAVAYMPDVTPKPLRSKGNAVINLIGYLGGIFATAIMMFMLKSKTLDDGQKVYADGQSFSLVFLIISVFMLISVVIMVLTVRENRIAIDLEDEDPAEEKSENDGKLSGSERKSLIFILVSVFFWFAAYNAVTTAFSRYCQKIWGTDLGKSSGYLLVATVVAIASFIPLGILSNKAGRKTTVIIGIILMTVSYAAAFFIREETPVMYIIFAVVGIGWATINVHSFPMVVELCNGRNIGKYTGYYYTFSMAAQIATPILSGYLIENLKGGYLILFPYAVVFMIFALITMSLVKHGDSKPLAKDVILDALSGD